MAFKLIDVLAHDFKHVESSDIDKKPGQWNGELSFRDVLARTPTVQFNSIMADALQFMRAQAGEILKKTKA